MWFWTLYGCKNDKLGAVQTYSTVKHISIVWNFNEFFLLGCCETFCFDWWNGVSWISSSMLMAEFMALSQGSYWKSSVGIPLM